MKHHALRRVLAILLVLCTLFVVVGCDKAPTTSVKDDIVILYTNDVHCAIDQSIGYAGLAAYKKAVLKQTPYVTLVDCGDAIQGDVIGAISDGKYIVDIMNYVGYDYAILGNHEFDYGMEQIKNLMEYSTATYLGCNLTYSGSGENMLAGLKPYEIKSYGDTEVAFIGVSTPETQTSSTPSYFMENGEFVYDFSDWGDGGAFYAKIQGYVDECRSAGADYVVVLSHLGDMEESAPYNSVELIHRTTGVDVVLDGHAHNVIPSRVELNLEGKNVLLSSTGTKLSNIGQLVISKDGYISTGLISGNLPKDEEATLFIDGVKATYEAQVNQIFATSDVALSCYNQEGIRLVRTRETAIGNLCADAYRSLAGADIGFVNGGGIRADLPVGNLTYGNVIAVHPFGNMLCMVEATGQEILDALEVGSHKTDSKISENGYAVGEYGGFLHVSGLRYTINTSIPSGVRFDDNGLFASIDGPRRVCNVQVLSADGTYVDIDPAATYKVASHNYLLKSSGDGITQFSDNKLLIDESMSDYQVLMSYISDYMEGYLGIYDGPEGRITVQ